MTVFTSYQYRISIDGFNGLANVQNFDMKANDKHIDYKVWYKNNYYSKKYIEVGGTEEFVLELSIPDSLSKIKNFSIASQNFLINEDTSCDFEELSFPNEILK